MAGNLEACDAAATGRHDLGLGHHGPRPSLNEGHAHLGKLGIGIADHRRLLNIGMLQQIALDLNGIDVLPPNLQHVLVATHEAQVSVGTQNGHVARVEPAVGVESPRRLRRLPVVLLHRVPGLHEQLARHGRGAGHSRAAAWLLLACFRVDDAQGKAFAWIARGIARLLVGGVRERHADVRADFRDAVGGEEPGRRQHRARTIRGRSGAGLPQSHEPRPQGSQIAGACLLGIAQRLQVALEPVQPSHGSSHGVPLARHPRLLCTMGARRAGKGAAIER
jgi:hypothetical protein